jgi:predicted DNA-binding transcriptional regulator AlpA
MPKPKSKKTEPPLLRPMLTLKEVLEIVPLSRTTIYRKEKAGTFPESHFLSENRRVYYLDDVQNWQAALTTDNPRRLKARKSRRKGSGT